jgi:hypothetical protein
MWRLHCTAACHDAASLFVVLASRLNCKLWSVPCKAGVPTNNEAPCTGLRLADQQPDTGLAVRLNHLPEMSGTEQIGARFLHTVAPWS